MDADGYQKLEDARNGCSPRASRRSAALRMP